MSGERVVFRVVQGDATQATFTYEADAREYVSDSNIGAPDPPFTLRRVRIRAKANTSETAETPANSNLSPGGGSEEGPAPISAEEVERETERQQQIYSEAHDEAMGDLSGLSLDQCDMAGRLSVAKDKLEAEARLAKEWADEAAKSTELIRERDALRARLEDAGRALVAYQTEAQRVVGLKDERIAQLEGELREVTLGACAAHAAHIELLESELAAERAELNDEQVEAGFRVWNGPTIHALGADGTGKVDFVTHGRNKVRAIWAAVREAKGKAAPAPIYPPAWSPVLPNPPATWRVGQKLGRTLYRDDKLVGMVDDAETSAAIVARMNGAPVAWTPKQREAVRRAVHDINWTDEYSRKFVESLEAEWIDAGKDEGGR
jgi:hypothetical protein